MSALYWMVTITNRGMRKKLLDLYRDCGVEATFSTLGSGTAASEMLDYFGLEATEKLVIASAVTEETWRTVKTQLERKLKIDVPGTGIAFLIPMSSVAGKKALQFLIQDQAYQLEEESTLKDTKYELLVVIANAGYTNLIMDAARKANAAGGTVIHAKGTGAERAQQFLGVSVVEEKEMVYIVVRREEKNAIMRAIMEDAGLESKARSIVFSLPVTATAGMRLIEGFGEEQI